MACPAPTFDWAAQCKTETSRVAPKVYYANYDDLVAAIDAGAVTVTNNVATFVELTPTAHPAFIYEVNQGIKFMPNPTATAAVTPAMADAWTHSAILQVVDSSAATDLQVAYLRKAKVVYFYELENVLTANRANRFKILGFDSGLRIADGGGVQNASADGGAALMTFASWTEGNNYESTPRMTVGDIGAFLSMVVPIV